MGSVANLFIGPRSSDHKLLFGSRTAQREFGRVKDEGGRVSAKGRKGDGEDCEEGKAAQHEGISEWLGRVFREDLRYQIS